MFIPDIFFTSPMLTISFICYSLTHNLMITFSVVEFYSNLCPNNSKPNNITPCLKVIKKNLMGCFKITLDCSTENIRYWQAVSQYGTTPLSQIDIYIYNYNYDVTRHGKYFKLTSVIISRINSTPYFFYQYLTLLCPH